MLKTLRALSVTGWVIIAASAAFAESDTDWRPNDRNNPDTCKQIWEGLGLPKTPNGGDKTTVCHKRFLLSHDNKSKTPDWVFTLLEKTKLTNEFDRPKNQGFSVDERVPPRGRPDPKDYAGTKDRFEIGHMVPSEDFNNNDGDMRDTFTFANAVPQAGDKFNAAIWRTLEDRMRKAAIARGKLYVITGPIRGNGTDRTIDIAKADNACGGAIQLDAIRTSVVCRAVNDGSASRCSDGVTVPVALYKVAYDPDGKTAYALVMPNRDHPKGQGTAYLDEWRVHVGAVEKLTGLRFFDGVPDRDRLVNRCEPTHLWAAATPKPKAKAKAQKKKRLPK